MTSYHMHECTAKDARRPKFRARNRYADVSPCKCLAFLCATAYMQSML